MSSLLQLLRMAFWMRPMQRALVVLAAAAAVAAFAIPPRAWPTGQPGFAPLLFFLMSLMLVTPVLSAGVFLRMLSAQRGIALLPHARGRLLAGVVGMALLVAALVPLTFWIAHRTTLPPLRPWPPHYMVLFITSFLFATQLAVGLFIASRSPRWALVVLLAMQLPGLVLRLAGVEDVPRLLSGPAGLVMPVLAWVVFGAWYLRAGPIAPAGWRGGYRAGSGAGFPLFGQPARTREEAMRRWLLGGLTPIRAGVILLLGMGLVVLAQLLIGRNSPPQMVTAIILATLSVGFVMASFGIAAMIAQRSRGLWLTGARDRVALHAWCEGQLLQYLAHIALPLAMAGVILWALLPARPTLPGAFVLAMSALWGCVLAWLGLAQSRGPVWMDLLLAVTGSLTWAFGLALALFAGDASPQWGALALLALLAVASRQLAAWRWRRADWPRASAPEPVG